MTNHFLKNLAAQRFLFVNGGNNGSGSSSGAPGQKPQAPEEDEYADYSKKPANNNVDTGSQEIDDVMKGTRSHLDALYEVADQGEESVKNKTMDPRLAENVKNLFEQIKAVIEKDKSLPHPLAQYVDSIFKRGDITERDAELLKRLDGTLPSFEEDLKKILKRTKKRLNNAEITGLKKAINKENQYAAQTKEIDEEAEKLLHEWREIFGKFNDNIMSQAYREDAVKSAAKTMGLPLRLNKKFIFYRNGRKASLEITDVSFEELDTLDKDPFGNPLPASFSPKFTSGPDKKDTNDPVLKVKIEYLDHDDPEIPDTTYGKMSLSGFQKWSDYINLREELKTVSDLEQVLNFGAIKVGSKFEYRKDVDAAEPGDAKDVTVTVQEIKDGKDKDGEPTKVIVLDKKIVTDAGKDGDGQQEKYEVTLAEFAKWARRNEAVRPVSSLDELRQGLAQHNQELNKKYDRTATHFPPIQLQQGEVLKYDDDTGRKFAIKSANDNEIEFDDGTKMTPTAFMRWVKNNEVEKLDPHAEAEKATHHLEGDEKEKAMQETLKTVNHDIEEMQKKLEDNHGGGHGEHGDVPHDDTIKKIAEHQHPYDPSKFSSSYLRKLWMNTNFVSIDGLIEMGKKISEFIKRKYKRRTEGAVGIVGERMFMGIWNELGADFKGIAQHAENEEVSHHAHHYETMGIETVRHELHIAPTKDILKAAIQVLAKKGQMRWDDHAFWDRMNHFGRGSITGKDGKPMYVDEHNYMDAIEKYLDKWFGNDTFREFRNSQDSSFKSIKNNFTDNAKRLETDPEGNGGLRFALQNMMFKHLQGEYVNPAQFESYLDFTITAGKLSMEDKMMFMLLGVGAEAKGAHGHAGMTLLPVERIAELEGDRLNNLPILDYFTSKTFPQFDYHGHPQIDKETGKQAQGYVQIWHIKKIIKEYIEDPLKSEVKNLSDPKQLDPFKTHLGDFIRDIQSWDPRARQRVEKSASDTTRWDHDDCDIFVPLLGEESIKQAVQKQGGARQAISNQGLQNAYVGFNNFTYLTINRLQKDIHEEKKHPGNKEITDHTQETVDRMAHLLKVFVRFDAILHKRFHHNDNLARFGAREYDNKAVNDSSRLVRTFVEEQRAFIEGLAKKWGMGDLWEKCMSKAQGEYPSADFARQQQNYIEIFNKQLSAKLQEVYEDKGAEGLYADFQAVQEENSNRYSAEGISLDIKGQLNKSPKKSEAQKEAAGSSLYEDSELKGKVGEITYLRNRIRSIGESTPEQVKTQRSKRLDELIDKIQDGDYSKIDRDEDVDILNRYISELKSELERKKFGEKKPDEEAKKKAEAEAAKKKAAEEEALAEAKKREEAAKG